MIIIVSFRSFSTTHLKCIIECRVSWIPLRTHSLDVDFVECVIEANKQRDIRNHDSLVREQNASSLFNAILANDLVSTGPGCNHGI
jgi:hypothetical protein